MTLNPRLNAIRDDLADSALRRQFSAPRYAKGQPARVVLGVVPVLREPKPKSALDTFFHFGEAVRVFDEADGFAWCQSQRDRYVGYVEAAALAMGEGSRPTHFVTPLGAYRYAEPDLRSPVIDFLPRHSPVTVIEAGFERRGTVYVQLHGGGFVPESCLSAEPSRSSDLVAAAKLYLGCPYLWAGRSFLGIDCSGLVHEAFRDLGCTMLRDADMQRETIGDSVGLGHLRELRRNDLIYIPGHVMICAGKGTVIHASGEGMTVRQDNLNALLRRWGYTVADLAVRRP